jgi:hypothetical protein
VKKNLIASIVVLCLFSIAAAQDTTPISVDRDRVLSRYGDPETVNLSLPIQPGIGMVSKADIKRSASALRLHFVVTAPAATPSWALEVLDKKDKKIWSYSAVTDQSADFWSDEIPGEVAKVRVFAVAELPELRLKIDRIIVSQKPTEGRGLTVDKLKSINDAIPAIQAWGRSVARLVFVRDGGGQVLCTGFLIAADLFMTNNHCIRTPTEMSSGLAEFDFDRANAIPVTLRFNKIVDTNLDLDFTLLRLATPTDRPPFTFDTSGGPRDMVMIQHPAGRPKQVSIANCKVMGPRVAGVTPALTDFGHGCDTLNGSSGAPAIDIQTGRVLGLHHLGYLPTDEPVNRAVQIQQILDHLRKNLCDPKARQALGFPPLPCQQSQ